MKTALITGATGFIGRYLVRRFSELGWAVVGIGTRPIEIFPKEHLVSYSQLVLPSPELASIVNEFQPEVCIHCAGRASVPFSVEDPQADFISSLDATFNLLDTLRLCAPQCRLVYLSSAAVYGNPNLLPICETHPTSPISPYGFHKYMCEQLCMEFFKIYGLPTAIVRIFSAYGPGLRKQVLWDACRKALTQPALRLAGTGNESRDFIHVRDVVKAINLIVEKADFQAEIYNLASGIETEIGALGELIVSYLEKPIPIEFDNESVVANPANWQADISRISRLGFIPETSLEKGTLIYFQWCRAELIG